MKLSSQSGDKPLWSQLYDILESLIVNGEYPVGEVLPSELALMEEFEVSRVTVRQAMDKLINAKMIERKRGKGTIVLARENIVETTFQSSFKGVKEKNNISDRRIISLEYKIPPVDVTYYFGISKTKSILLLTRQTFVDGKPVAQYETYFNPLVPFNNQTDFSGSMYDKLEEVGYPITRVKEKITASIMTNQEKEEFKTEKIEAIMNRIRLGSSHDTPIEYTYSKYVANGYELVINLQ